jgi:hypothetical protein
LGRGGTPPSPRSPPIAASSATPISWSNRSGGIEAFPRRAALPYHLPISFPPHVAAMAFPQLPGDDRWFIPAETATRQVGERMPRPDAQRPVGQSGMRPA